MNKFLTILAVMVCVVAMVPFSVAASVAAIHGNYTFSLAAPGQYGAQTIVGVITFDGAGHITALSYTQTSTTSGGGTQVCTGKLAAEGSYTMGSSYDLGALSMSVTSSCKGQGGAVQLGMLAAAPVSGIATVVYLTPVAGKSGNGPSGMATKEW
jgi:hypothetical protein